MNLSKCQVFTPRDTVHYMLDRVGYIENVFGKRIIDNSCGTGNILVEVVKRFISDAKKKKMNKSAIIKGLESCVHGYDIDPRMVDVCVENLNRTAKELGISNHINWKIFVCDGLYINSENKFDYVVGNPPYIAYADLSEAERKKTRESFSSCSAGKYDYSYAFIEKGLSMLSNNGRMVLLTPSNMFKTVYGYNLRKLIKNEIIEIIDCSALNIFKNVLTSPAISIYQKGSNSNLLVYRERFADKSETERLIEKRDLAEKWDFTGFVATGEKRFGDYFKVSNSIATLANKVFIHNINEDGTMEINIEQSVLRTAKSPKTEQYNISQSIIFPYYYDRGKLEHYDEQSFKRQFPLAYKYLKRKKVDLLARDSDDKAQWFEYGRSQALSHLNCEKVLMSTIITNKVRAYKLDSSTIPYSGLYIIAKKDLTLDSAIVILQSQDFYNYLVSKGVKARGESIRISSKDIEDYIF